MQGYVLTDPAVDVIRYALFFSPAHFDATDDGNLSYAGTGDGSTTLTAQVSPLDDQSRLFSPAVSKALKWRARATPHRIDGRFIQ